MKKGEKEKEFFERKKQWRMVPRNNVQNYKKEKNSENPREIIADNNEERLKVMENNEKSTHTQKRDDDGN